MTQAWNLSQLANKVNAAGKLDAGTGLANAVPVANGGTNNASLGVVAGGIYYGDGSKIVETSAGTSGQVLLSGGAGAPTWGTLSAGGSLNNIQYFTSSGTYTPTAGTSFVIVEVIGGGGASGASTAGSATNTTTGPGGGGGFARKRITSSFSGVTVTVGAGGVAVTNASGGSGGTTSFGALVSATGGAGSTAQFAAGVFAGGAPGSGSGGDLNLTGSTGVAAPSQGTGGFAPVYGAQTIGTATSLQPGIAATGYGNGATGAHSQNNSARQGANGSAGLVIVYEYK